MEELPQIQKSASNQELSLLKQSLSQQSRLTTVSLVLKSNLPTFQKITRSGESVQLITYIIASLTRYIKSNFPGTENSSDIIADFAELLLEDRQDWKLPDVDLFVKFMRKNPQLMKQSGAIGYTITEKDLTTMAGLYDEHRAEQRENILKEKRDEIENIIPNEKAAKMAADLLNKIQSAGNVQPKTAHEIQRETLEKYEADIISKLPGKNKEELMELLLYLKDFYNMAKNENDKKVVNFYFLKAMTQICTMLELKPDEIKTIVTPSKKN